MKSPTTFPALILSAIICIAGAATATAQSRYTPPSPAPLSADLASPWILQLRNKPSSDGHYAVQVARPLPPSLTQLRRTIPVLTPSPPRQARGNVSNVAFPQPAPPRRTAKHGGTPKFDPKYEIHTVAYDTDQKPGTIVIDTQDRFLYLVEKDGMARRYGIGVGRDGFRWSGTEKIARKAEWPSWTPPKEMIVREAARGHYIPDYMDGGPGNPLGARALYLGETLYRIHGTNQPWTIGRAVSSGCIRMRDEDVMDLYDRVKVGTKVVVG